MSLLKMTILSFKKKGEQQLTDIPQMYMAMFNPASTKQKQKSSTTKSSLKKEMQSHQSL